MPAPWQRLDRSISCSTMSARAAASGRLISMNLEEDVWRFVLEVSLLTAMRMSRLVVPAMRERGGRIVNMSSDAAFVGDAGLADYAAAKMGVIGFTRSLARELAPIRRHGQRGRARRHPDARPRPADARCHRAHQSHDAGRVHRASRRMSPAVSPSSRATMPATSPGRRC